MTSNKNKNTNGKPVGKKTSTPRHNFAAMKKVKEARAKSPLTPEEQVRLIREFTAWDDVPPADVDELVSALMGNSYSLGGTTYLAPDDYRFVKDMMDDPAPGKVSWASESPTGDFNPPFEEEDVEESKEDASDPDDASAPANGEDSLIKSDREDKDIDSTGDSTSSVNMTLESDDADPDDTNDEPASGNFNETEESLKEDEDSLADSIGSTFKSIGGFLGGLRDKAHESWVDWTADVRVPVESLKEDEDSLADSIGSTFKSIGGFLGGLRDKAHESWVDWTADVRVPVEDAEDENTVKPVEGFDDAPAGKINVVKGHRGTPISIDDHDVIAGSDGLGVDDVETVEEKEFHIPNPLNGLRKIKSVAGSFVDGVAGRPIHTKFVMDPAVNEDRKTPEWRVALKWTVRVLAVIGGIAIVRAALDAFRPRR